MIYTFDVFDTLITRMTIEPKGIFALMQAQLCSNRIEGLAEHLYKYFPDFRIDAERVARQTARNHGKQEVSLQRIYESFAYMNGLAWSVCEYLMKLELEIEYEASLPVTENIELVKKYVKTDSVFLISDMYLPEAEIRKLLMKHDAIFQQLPLLVSCQVDKVKSNGSLYQYFMHQYCVVPEMWIHYGNDPHADGEMVQMLGGKWMQVNRFEMTERDKRLLLYNGHGLDMQILLGCIRGVRAYAEDMSLQYSVGAEISAPILYGYIYWVIENAKQMKIKNLFFIARDGYILKEIADYVIQKEMLDIQTGYLYGSRYAWRLPAVGNNIEALKRWFSEKCTFHCIAQLSEMLGLDESKIYLYVPKCFGYTSNLSVMEISIVRVHLLLQDEFWESVYDVVQAKRENAVCYLRQELKGKDRVAFVELNGSGYTQQCLKMLLEGIYDEDIITFFYSMDGINAVNHKGCWFKKFSYEDHRGKEVIELLARAPYGQTYGYEERQGKIFPIIANAVKDYIGGAEFEKYLFGIMASVRAIEAVGKKWVDSTKISLLYVKYAMDFVDAELQMFIGDMPFSSNSYAIDIFTYAPIITNEVMQKIESVVYRNGWCEYYLGGNLEYSLKRTSESIVRRMRSFLKQENIRPPKKYNNIHISGKIILYGAGKHGKEVYEYLLQIKECEVIHWVDKNFKEKGKEIESPEIILSEEFDVIVVAVMNIYVRQEVYYELLDMGIPLAKIL